MTTHLCECGCGHPTRIAPVNDRSKGWIKGQPLKFIKGHNMAQACAIKSASAVGNRYLSTHGYVVVTTGPRRRQYEHILVAERAIGRHLRNFGRGNPKTEVVHHINGDKTDNRSNNLLVCTHEYHVSLHHRLEASAAWPEFQKVTRRGFGGRQ